jgi:predicted DNA-binding ribbon-helix-helix protein
MDARNTIRDACRTKLRILQRHGVKAAVRLELIFWSQMEEFAREDKMTVSQLAFAVFDAHADEQNRTSLLRCYCLDRSRRKARVEQLKAQNFDVLATIAACPVPVALITPERRLAAFNPPFGTLMDNLRRQSDDKRDIQLTFNEPLSAIRKRLIEQPLRISAYQIGLKIGDASPQFFSTRFALVDRTNPSASLLVAFIEPARHSPPR